MKYKINKIIDITIALTPTILNCAKQIINTIKEFANEENIAQLEKLKEEKKTIEREIYVKSDNEKQSE